MNPIIEDKPVETHLPEVREIPASAFRRYPSNRTISEEQARKRAESIRQVGVLQPITARPMPDPETDGALIYQVVAGECRWRGCALLDPDYPVPTFVREMDDKEAARVNAVENFQRDDLDVIDQAKTLRNLRDSGWTVQDICGHTALQQSMVFRYLSISELPESVHEMIRAEKIDGMALELISSLPKDRAEAAIDVLAKMKDGGKLNRKTALDVIRKDFVEPLEREKDWAERKRALLQNHPDAKWQEYPAAAKTGHWKSGYEKADDRPDQRYLSDAARAGELVVPTWGELARKFSAPLLLGVDSQGNAGSYVLADPLVDAERAMCNESPECCVFVHSGAVAAARLAAEKRKREEDEKRDARKKEVARMADLILAPDGIGKTAMVRVSLCGIVGILTCLGRYEDVGRVLGLSDDAGKEDIDAAVVKYLKTKRMGICEAGWRLTFAAFHCGDGEPDPELFFGTGAVKPADFPMLHAEFEKMLSDRAREARENEQAANAAKADGEEAA